MIDEADRDNDGEINESEFLRIMKKTSLYWKEEHKMQAWQFAHPKHRIFEGVLGGYSERACLYYQKETELPTNVLM